MREGGVTGYGEESPPVGSNGKALVGGQGDEELKLFG